MGDFGKGLTGAVMFTAISVCGCGGQTYHEECPADDPLPLAVTDFSDLATLQMIELSGDTVDSLVAEYQTVSAPTIVPVDQFLLSVLMNVTYAETARSYSHGLADWLLSSAQASCLPMVGTSSQQLQNLTIWSSADFSSEYPAGSPLNELFLIHAKDSLYVTPDNLQHDLAYDTGDTFSYLPDYLSGESRPAAPLQFALKPAAELTETDRHVFTVTYKLADGDVFTTISDPVWLAPGD